MSGSDPGTVDRGGLRFPRGPVTVRMAVLTALVVGAVAVAVIGLVRAHRGGSNTTALRIDIAPQGVGRPQRLRYELRCQPAGGTLPHPAHACTVLLRRRHPFAPVPSRAICSQISDGPAIAVVHGTLRGRAVNARLRRSNGCQIARWNRLAAILPTAVGITPPSGQP